MNTFRASIVSLVDADDPEQAAQKFIDGVVGLALPGIGANRKIYVNINNHGCFAVAPEDTEDRSTSLPEIQTSQEMDELPDGSVVMDRDMQTFIKMSGVWRWHDINGTGLDHEILDYSPILLVREGYETLTKGHVCEDRTCGREHFDPDKHIVSEDHNCSEDCDLEHVDEDHDCSENCDLDHFDDDMHIVREFHDCDEECERVHSPFDISFSYKINPNGLPVVQDNKLVVDLDKSYVYDEDGDQVCWLWELPKALRDLLI